MITNTGLMLIFKCYPRVPRVELPAWVTPAKIGNLLVHDQHDEDGKFGINVINEENKRWRLVFSKNCLGWNRSKILKLIPDF